MTLTAKRKPGKRKPVTATKRTYYDRTIVQPASRLVEAISKKGKKRAR